jgi:hypothetical protein
MAEVKTIKINVDTKSAVDAMDNLSKATHDVNQSFEEVYGDLQPLTTRMGEAEDRLYELANAGKTTTKEYKDLLKTVGEYRKVQIKTDLAVDSAALTMGQKLGSAIGGVSSGFTVATGLMGTFGAESQEVEGLLIKVNSAMALTQGIQGIKESLPLFQRMASQLAKLPVIQNLVTIAQKAWNLAMAANPVGLLIAGITALIGVGALLIKFLNDSASATAHNTKMVVANEKAIKKQTETLKNRTVEAERSANQELAMARASGMSAKAIRELELKLIDEKIARERSTKATLLDTYETNKNTLAKLRASGADDELIKRQQELTQEVGKNIITQNENIKGALNERKDIINRHLVEVKTAEVTANNEARQRAIEASNTAREKRKTDQEQRQKEEQERRDKEASELLKHEEEKLKIEQQANEKRIAIEDAQFKLLQDLTYSDREKEIANLVEQYDAKFLIAGENAELEKQLIEQQKLDIDAINQKFNEKEINDAQEVSDKQAKINEQKRENQIQAVQGGLSVIGNLAELFAGKSRKSQERAFKVQKAANVASATIDTYKSAQSAFASAGNPILGAIFAAAAITAGLANIKKISQTKFEGGGESAGGASATPSFTATPSQTATPRAPQFNIVGNSGINQLANINQQPIQAYVVSGQVTTAQSLDRNKIENATI